ncbi:hypothetical protein GCM10018954_079980 [Kutzneria kofuensis]
MLATKVFYPMDDKPNHGGTSRRWIVTEVENSLRRLQTDHIDLYQIHRPRPDTDIEETLSALTDLVRSGKVRAIGSSTFPASQIVEAQWAAERRGYERFRTEQPPYSIINRSIEREVLPVCQRYGMGTLVWSPLGQGLLTGLPQGPARHDPPWRPDAAALRRRPQAGGRRAARAAGREAGLPMTQLAMAFAINHPGVTSAIIGPRTMAQLDDVLAGADVRLDDEVLDRIDEIAPPGGDASPTRWPTRRRRSPTPGSAAAESLERLTADAGVHALRAGLADAGVRAPLGGADQAGFDQVEAGEHRRDFVVGAEVHGVPAVLHRLDDAGHGLGLVVGRECGGTTDAT